MQRDKFHFSLALSLALLAPAVVSAGTPVTLPADADRSVPVSVAAHLYSQNSYMQLSGQLALLPNAKFPKPVDYEIFSLDRGNEVNDRFVVTEAMNQWMKSSETLIWKDN